MTAPPVTTQPVTTSSSNKIHGSKSSTSAAAVAAATAAAAVTSKLFAEDLSVSESTDITDVTAKSHSVNSYATSLQAEVGSTYFSTVNAVNAAAALNPFRFQRHLNLDTGKLNFLNKI